MDVKHAVRQLTGNRRGSAAGLTAGNVPSDPEHSGILYGQPAFSAMSSFRFNDFELIPARAPAASRGRGRAAQHPRIRSRRLSGAEPPARSRARRAPLRRLGSCRRRRCDARASRAEGAARARRRWQRAELYPHGRALRLSVGCADDGSRVSSNRRNARDGAITASRRRCRRAGEIRAADVAPEQAHASDSRSARHVGAGFRSVRSSSSLSPRGSWFSASADELAKAAPKRRRTPGASSRGRHRARSDSRHADACAQRRRGRRVDAAWRDVDERAGFGECCRSRGRA